MTGGRTLVMAVALAGLVCGCPSRTTQRTARATPLQPSEDAARALEQAAVTERAGKQEEALADYASVAARFPTSAEAADALLARADLALRLERRDVARQSLEDVALKYPGHPASPRAKLMLARMDIQDGRTTEGVSAMRSAYQQIDDPKERGEAAKEMGTTLAQSGQASTAVSFLAEAEASATGPEKEALQARLLELIDGHLTAKEVVALRESQRPNSFTHNLLTLKLARIFQHVGEDERAKETYKAFLAAAPQSPLAPVAQSALSTLEQRSQVSPHRVGVILPMSGKFEQAGQRVLAALNLGFQAAVNEAVARGQTTPPPSAVEVVVMDDRGEADGAAKAVDALVQNDRVMAIVGAITTQGAKDAAIRAEALKVPLLTMARREGLAEIGPWTFHLGLTDEKQARAVARLAAETLGFKRIALLYPRLPKGVALINAFWDTFESMGGQIAGAESYDHDETTFSTPVRKLVGRYYLDARGDYAQCMSAARQVDAAYKRQKAMEECKSTTAPVIDFDAVFIADYHKTVGLIAPALAFEDVFVGNDERAFQQYKQTTRRTNAKRVILLGTNGFNDKSLPGRGGKYVQGALFVDGFNPNDGRPETQAFIKAFADVSGGSRAELREAQAYDAGRILGTIFTTQPQSRQEFRDRLSNVKDYPAISGPTSFDNQGGSVTPLHVFTIKGEHIVPAVIEPQTGG